ncbi:MAG TPA: hypothetical protein PLB81_11020 [Deltaproteobacteria bacterium]|nr:hypothetical protein [Deltaproteobacteria bacterium]
MNISEEANMLAGFVLAHAAWNVSDLPPGVPLVPLALCVEGSERKLFRFEAETQEQAIAMGKEFVAKQQASASAWAFARVELMDTVSGKKDAIFVDAWAAGMGEPIRYIQPFQPYASGAFKLLGAAIPVVAGAMLSPAQSEPYLAVLYQGVFSHAKAAGLWALWQ